MKMISAKDLCLLTALCLLFFSASGFKGGSASKPTSRSQSPPSPATLVSINTALESIKTKIERGEPLRMEAFYQLESSAITTNNNPLINLVRDMVSTLKKSAASLTSAPNADKVDPSVIVCKCKFKSLVKYLHHFTPTISFFHSCQRCWFQSNLGVCGR